MTDPLHLDTTSVDISAGTALAKVGGHVVRVSLAKSGDETQDVEDETRRRLLRDKAALTQPSVDPDVPDDKPMKEGAIDMPKYSATQLRSMLARGHAIRNSNGEPAYAIGDKDDLQAAINVARGNQDPAVRQHIVRRARAMGQSSAVPKSWGASGKLAAETPPPPKVPLSTLLVLEGEVPRPVILQEATADNGGVMRLKVPFYIGESIARAPGFDKRIYFSKTLLPGIVQEGKRQIQEGKQPLNVYARHAHATSGDHLPVGAVVDLEQEGRIGYATLEVSPTSTGRDIQVLAQNKHLNAVSLRSGLGRFELEDRKVNGEAMLTPLRLAIDGVDFAPDSPAQPTYGIQILQETPRIEEPTTKTTSKRRQPHSMSDTELTLDTLRAEYPEIVAEIEAPLRRDLAKHASELNILVQERNVRMREEKLREIAANFPDPAKALPVLQELCAECETDAQVAEKAFPVLLEALRRAKATDTPAIEKPAKEVLLEMFRPGGAGQPSLVQEDDGTKDLDPAQFAGVDLAEV